jgi:hypothetical protein
MTIDLASQFILNAKTPRRQDGKQGTKSVLPQRNTKRNKENPFLYFLCLFVAKKIVLPWRLGALASWRYLPWHAKEAV